MRIQLKFWLLILTLCSLARAGTSGKIAGNVVDAANGSPLPGVNIIVEGTTMGSATDDNGYYVILNVPAGRYSLQATMIGYTSVIYRDVSVSIDLTTTIDFNLTATVLEAGESVVVTAQRPMMRPDEFSSRHIVSAEDMRVQPVDNFQQIARNQAGVVGTHFRGGRSGEVLIVIDGIAVKDPAGEYSGNMGGFTADVPEAAIQELEVTLGGFSAEYGNVQSGVLNLALREGAERYAGRTRVMTTNFGAGLNELLMGKRDKWFETTYQHKLQNWYQFSLSGPLVIGRLLFGDRSKANFSFSAEIDDRQQGNFINEMSFSQSYQGKVTLRPSAKTKLAFGGLYSKRDWDQFFFAASKFGPGKDYPHNEYFDYNASNDSLTHYVYVKDPWKYPLNGEVLDSAGMLIDTTNAVNDTTHFSGVHKYYVGPMQDYLWDYHQQSRNFYAIWTHSLSSRTYYEMRYQTFFSNYHYATPDVEDRDRDGDRKEPLLWDTRQVGPHPIFRDLESNYWWVRGDDPGWRDQKSWSNTFKGDLVSQVTNNHLLKAGFEVSLHRIDVENISWGLGVGTERKDIWQKRTIDFGLYAQDKVEFQGIVALIGLRWDYFDPNGLNTQDYPFLWSLLNFMPGLFDTAGVNYPGDYNNPYTQLGPDGLPLLINPTTPKPKSQLSPRIAISHPITDQDVIHFSYGHYFQRPDGYYLYRNINFQAFTKVGNYVGNPNSAPEKTVSYEVGLDHLFTNDIKFSVSGYYKDVTNLMNWYKYVLRNLQGIEINVFGNADYGNIKGLELALTKRTGRFWGGSVNYTYSVAKGRSSTTTSGAGAFTSARRLNLLDFDQTHTLNANLTLKTPGEGLMGIRLLGDWRANFQHKYGSGLPYSSYGTGKVNDQRLPATHNTDLRLSKQIRVPAATMDLFLDVFNLFNRRNVDWIGSSKLYEQTGKATIVRDETAIGGGFIHNPQALNDRRQFRIGVEVIL